MGLKSYNGAPVGQQQLFVLNAEGNPVPVGNLNPIPIVIDGGGSDPQLRKDIDNLNSKMAKNETQQTKLEKIRLNNFNVEKPLITFIDDDGYSEVMSRLKPLYDSKGIKACAAIISSNVGLTSFMSINQIKSLQNDGWEILSHTVTHQDLSQMGPFQVETELKDSLQSLTDWGLDVQSLAYPFGGSNAVVRDLVKKYYRCAFATGGPAEAVPINTSRLNRTMLGSNFETQNGDTYEYYKSKVDDAVARNAWMTVCTHCFAMDDTQMGYLSQLIDYIKSQNIEIVTVRQALERFENIFESRDEAGGGYTIISKNGKVYSTNIVRDKLIINKPILINQDSPVHSFEADTMTVISYLYGDNSGFPGGAGTLIAYRPHIEADLGLSYQQWIPYGNNKLYQRQWNPATNNWSSFTVLGGETIKVDDMDARNLSDMMWTYDTGKITYTPISAAHAANQDFPDSKAGMLITDKMYWEEGFQRQKYKIYNEITEYERFADKNGNWSGFHRLQYQSV